MAEICSDKTCYFRTSVFYLMLFETKCGQSNFLIENAVISSLRLVQFISHYHRNARHLMSGRQGLPHFISSLKDLTIRELP